MSYITLDVPWEKGVCILPFINCPYRVLNIDWQAVCDDIDVGPFNSDAGCYKVTWKRNMILSSKMTRVPIPVIEDENE